LDEPTNFLDLESVDSLISACNKYKGALLLVSHNRDFLRKCAQQYLSVVPGHFAMYPDLKSAERATYTFIAEMEEGGTVSGKSMALNTGGGSVHASQVKGTAAEGKVDAVNIAVGAAAAKPAAGAAKAAAPAAEPVKVETYTVNERCLAFWPQDNKYYNAVVKKVVGTGKDVKYAITYTEYGNSATIEPTKMKKAAAKAPAAAAPAKK
jgi:ABC-type multidrug transport system ATPase subunit